MIRAATFDDLDSLVEGNLQMALETEGLRLDPSTLRRGIEAILSGRAPGFYRVVEKEGKVVAQLLVTFEWSDWRARMVWWIQSVYVWPGERGLGAFGQLYRALAEEAREAGAAGLRLYVDQRNARASAVYAALGMNGEHYRVFESMF